MSIYLDFIRINNVQITRPPKFMPQREDIYKGNYTTCTGKKIADKVGWKFADMTLEWDALPQSMVSILCNMDGENTFRFDDLDGTEHIETVIRTSIVGLRHRYTQNGVTYWKDVSVSISFIGSHT